MQINSGGRQSEMHVSVYSSNMEMRLLAVGWPHLFPYSLYGEEGGHHYRRVLL